MFDFIAKPLGQFLYFVYNTIAFKNYGLAIIIFTIVIKLVLLPLTIKQYRSTAKMQEIQPLIEDIQRRYKNDKEKMNQELMKLYQEHKYNPAGGCLPLLIQMPILFSLYWVINQPLRFILNKTPEQINKLIEYVTETVGKVTMGSSREIGVLNYFNEHISELSNVSDLLKPEELINLKFLGINLGLIPKFDVKLLFGSQMAVYLPLLAIPLLAVTTTFISTKLMTPKASEKSKSDTSSTTQNTMAMIGPLMTLLFSFQLPAGVGLYWIASNLFQIFQQLYINEYVMKKKEVSEK
ncbi:MAG TPA: YidC/Oxa1 family membrane protein insertase [Clostridiaceae bacterium]|nr:YidC/Oxa1 family membrane protein insertase [Clostridiaceae bacterium]